MSHTYHRYRIGDEPVAGYRLTDHLGAGGFGEVWKANAPGGTEVALKIIDLTGQQGVQEFASLRVVKKVRHPNLISLQAFWMKDESGQIIDEAGEAQKTATPLDVTMAAPDPKRETQAIAMTAEFARPVELLIAMQLGSMSLHKRLEECREQGQAGIPVAELLEYLEQAARGIDFLNKPIHDLGKGPMPIVHGDIKPHNILVIGDAAVVCDFGLARAVETLRKTSMAPVTVAYASPESFKGKVTPQTDQYSLAVTYVELRTGRLPFDETLTPYQVMEAHVTRMLDFSRLPDQEQQVILRATDPTPEARWPSSRDMILALRHAVASTGELPLRPGEVAFSGGPTPTHSLTGRPMARDTDLPTRMPTDPHKDTAFPGGHTPSQLLSQRTAAKPFDPYRTSDALAETAMVPAKKKSRGALIAGFLVVVAAGVAAAIFVPGLLNKEKATAMLPSATKTVPTQQPAQTGNSPSSAPQPPDATKSTTEAPETATPPAPEDPNAQYVKLVQDKINGGEFAAAVDLLDKAPSKLPAFEKEALQKRLHSAFIAYLDTQVQKRAYGRSLVELEEAPEGIGLTADDKQQQREKIRQSWLEQAREEYTNGQFNRAIEAAGNLLKRFDGDRDAQLIIARSQVRLGDNPAAVAILNKLGKTADLPAEYQPLHAGLLLLATGFESNSPDAAKLLDGFTAFITLEKDRAPPAALALTSWEHDRLTALRTTVVSNLQQQLASLPADQAGALVKKLEQLDSSTELQMFKVKSQLEVKQFAEARKTLAAVAAKAPPDDLALKTSIDGTGLLLTLNDPASPAKDLTKAGADALKMVATVSPSLRAELAAALELRALADPSQGGQAALRDPAFEFASKALDIDPLDQAATKRVARLLAMRLAAKVEQPSIAKEDLPQIISQCEQVESAGLNTPLTDALHAECLMLSASRDAGTIKTLAERAPADQPYGQFIRAKALRARPQPDWKQIVDLLQKAYSDPKKLAPAVAAPFRRAEAANMLIEAAAKKRAPIEASNPAGPLASPFADAVAADDAYKLLQLAGTLAEDLDAAGLKLSNDRQRELSLNLGLAAAWNGKPEASMAQKVITPLLKSSDADLGNNAFPVLLTALRAGKADAPAAIQAAQRFLDLFQKQYSVADQQAVEVYSQVVKPALELADAQAAGKSPPADLDKFYAEAADFITHYKRAAWPFADKQAEAELLLTKAITLNPKVAKYYTSRGAARISLVPPNVEGTLADATAAGKIDANLPAAYGLQGYALIYRSRQQATREARLADLEQALARAAAAVEKANPEDKDRGTDLLYVSMAHLEKATFETDPKAQKENLDKAVAYAQQAIDLEKAYPDYAYVALGNALEDLAWLLNDEPEKNYTASIDAFSRAIENNLSSADAWVGRARCYYKAVVDTKLDPQVLGRTREEALQSAISDLEQAQQLNADLVEPKLWLGRAQRELKKFAESDAALSSAVEIAEKQQLPERAMYLIEWTRNALINADLKPEEQGKIVRERAEKLKAAPNLGGVSSAKQAAILIGDSLLSEKKVPEAIKEYDAALTEYDKDPTKPADPAKSDGSDVSLLLARAYCRLNLPETQWNLTAAEGVIKDASRIKQLKPSPHFEALGHWYAANARSRSLRSTSPTITPQHKLAYLDGAVTDVRNAINVAPADPGGWEWRGFGTRLIGTKITQTTDAATLKAFADESRKWIDDAIAQAAKRPDLASQLERLQRVQQELDTILAGKGLPRK